jgi:hypothetical protein
MAGIKRPLRQHFVAREDVPPRVERDLKEPNATMNLEIGNYRAAKLFNPQVARFS